MKQLDIMKLGDHIRRIRDRTGSTQEQIAFLCQTTASHISHIENGTSRASLETIYRIASAMEISIDHLLADQYEEPVTAMESQMIERYRSLSPHHQIIAVRLMEDLLRT